MSEHVHHPAPGGAQRGSSVDPVCGMLVAADTRHRYSYQGREYLFCCNGCLERFKAAPTRYLDKQSAAAPPAGHARGRPVPVKVSDAATAQRLMRLEEPSPHHEAMTTQAASAAR